MIIAMTDPCYNFDVATPINHPIKHFQPKKYKQNQNTRKLLLGYVC